MRTIDKRPEVPRLWLYSGALTFAVIASLIFASFLTS